MKKEAVLEVMSHIDPSLIEGADVRRKRLPAFTKRLAAAAACLSLCVLTIAAARYGNTWLKRLENGKGYEVESNVTTYSVEDLGPELQDFYTGAWEPGKFSEYDPSVDVYAGGGYVTSHASVAEAEEFMGLSLRDNSLLEDNLEGRVALTAGHALYVSGTSLVEGQSFNWNAVIFLDWYGTDAAIGALDNFSQLSSEEYKMANGELAVIVLRDSADNYENTQYRSMEAYFSADGIRYCVGTGDGGISENYEAQRALLYEILDAFA